jgi:glycosyltransferase involved in cell wall biosynthesis
MKGKILVVGQLPPPFHGSNVMAKVTVSTLEKDGYQVIFVDKSFAKSIETIGKPSLRKILRVPVLAIELLIACLFKRPAICIYFIACGKSAFLIDTFLLLLLRLSRIPYILRFGGKGFYKLQSESFIWHFLVSYTLSNALGGIVLGQAIKQDVDLFIPDERLVYVPNGIENQSSFFKKTRNNNIQVLFLSNLHPKKGPFDVLKAANILVQQNINMRFVLAGADSSLNFTKQLRSYIINNGLDEYVTMIGAVYGEQKDNLFRTSDIFVFPTYFERETFGIVNIEAMSWGLPVISSTEGAIPEIVQDGITGFIVNPKSPEEIADKIMTLVNNPDLIKKMGIKGREVFKSKYTSEAYARNLDGAIKFFENILTSNKT